MRVQRFGNTFDTNALQAPITVTPMSIWQPTEDETQFNKTSFDAYRHNFRQRAIKAAALGAGIGAAGLLGGVALMSTGPIGCLPGILLLLLTPVGALVGGLASLTKGK